MQASDKDNYGLSAFGLLKMGKNKLSSKRGRTSLSGWRPPFRALL
jgi:hypothetical protein